MATRAPFISVPTRDTVIVHQDPVSFTFEAVARGLEHLHRFLFAAANTVQQAQATMTQVGMEFLPSGENGQSFHPGPGSGPKKPWGHKFPVRLQFLAALNPVGVMEGARTEANGRKYTAYVFKDVVILECEEYAQSAYAFKNQEGWMDLATTPKTDLLKNKPTGFIRRFVHDGDWQGKMTRLIQTGQP